MLNRFFAAAALLAASIIPLHAQQEDSDQPPVYHGTSIHVDGIFVTPIPGIPVTATVLIQNERPTSDGSVEIQRTINFIGRDSSGRIHNERRSLVPNSFHGRPRLIEVRIFDPQTRINTFYNLATHVARQQVLPEPLKDVNRFNSQARVEELGSNVLDGLEAKGTRRTTTIQANRSGTGAPVEVVDECWYSEDLHLNLLVRRTDPRSGVQTVTLKDIKREEPPQEFFEVPQDYKIVDMTPPAGAPAAGGLVTAANPAP
jgi:hypothetical protein